MNLIVEWRGTVSAALRDSFEEGVRKSLNAFFKRYPEPVDEIKLTAFRPATGAANGRLIRPASPTADFGQHPVGYRAMITIDGSKTQGLVCLMTIDEKTVEEIAEIVEAGPYFKKRQVVRTTGETENTDDQDEGAAAVLQATEQVAGAEQEVTTELVVGQAVSTQTAPASTSLDELSDIELIQHVALILKQRKEVSANLAEASLREKTLTDEVHALEHDLAAKRAELAIVSSQVEAGTAKLSEFPISESLRQKALAAKARLDDSLGDLLKT